MDDDRFFLDCAAVRAIMMNHRECRAEVRNAVIDFECLGFGEW